MSIQSSPWHKTSSKKFLDFDMILGSHHCTDSITCSNLSHQRFNHLLSVIFIFCSKSIMTLSIDYRQLSLQSFRFLPQMYCTFLFSHSKDTENEIYTQSTYKCNPQINYMMLQLAKNFKLIFPKNIVKHARVRAPVVSYEHPK